MKPTKEFTCENCGLTEKVQCSNCHTWRSETEECEHEFICKRCNDPLPPESLKFCDNCDSRNEFCDDVLHDCDCTCHKKECSEEKPVESYEDEKGRLDVYKKSMWYEPKPEQKWPDYCPRSKGKTCTHIGGMCPNSTTYSLKNEEIENDPIFDLLGEQTEEKQFLDDKSIGILKKLTGCKPERDTEKEWRAQVIDLIERLYYERALGVTIEDLRKKFL